MYTIKNFKAGNRNMITDYFLKLGVISKRAMILLPKKSYRNFIRKLADMKHEGLIEEIIASDKSKVMRLRDYLSVNKVSGDKDGLTTKDIIASGFSENELSVYENGVYQTASRITSISAQKAHRFVAESDTKAFMMASELSINDFDADAVFVESRKIKGMNYEGDDIGEEDGKKKVAFSKTNGVVASPGGNYVAYRLLTNKVSRLSVGEYKIINHTRDILNKIRKQKPESNFELSSGLLLTNSLDYFTSALAPTDFDDINSVRFNNFLNLYNEVFVLPYSKDGVELMKIMLTKDWRIKLKLFATNNQYDGNEDKGSIYDVRSDNDFILAFCVPDVIRLKKFADTAKMSTDKSRKYYVACFDFQANFVKSVVGNSATVVTATINDFLNLKEDK